MPRVPAGSRQVQTRCRRGALSGPALWVPEDAAGRDPLCGRLWVHSAPFLSCSSYRTLGWISPCTGCSPGGHRAGCPMGHGAGSPRTGAGAPWAPLTLLHPGGRLCLTCQTTLAALASEEKARPPRSAVGSTQFSYFLFSSYLSAYFHVLPRWLLNPRDLLPHTRRGDSSIFGDPPGHSFKLIWPLYTLLPPANSCLLSILPFPSEW